MQIKRVRNRKHFVLTKKGIHSRKKLENKIHKLLLENVLVILIILSAVVGVVLGLNLQFALKPLNYHIFIYLEFPGVLLLNMMRMMIVPLLTSSIIVGMISLETPSSGKLIAVLGAYHLVSAWIAMAIAVSLLMVFSPYYYKYTSANRQDSINISSQDPLHALHDFLSHCFPDNFIRACFERTVTEFEIVNNGTKDVKRPKLVSQRGTNVLGIVVVSTIFGYILNLLKQEGKPLRAFFISANAVVMTLMNILLWYTPIGIAFLIASSLIVTVDIEDTISYIALYMAMVLAGFAIQSFIYLPITYFVITKKNPFLFATNIAKALLTAWGTDSSFATLPVSIKCLINNCNLNPNMVNFIMPHNTTLNFDGAILYEALACMFIAYLNGISLSVFDIIAISLTSSAATIGSNSLPQSGQLTMVVVLTAMELPLKDISLFVSIDWFIDRFRSVMTVWGDCIGAGVIDHLFIGYFDEEEDSSPLTGTSKISLESKSVLSEVSVISDTTLSDH